METISGGEEGLVPPASPSPGDCLLRRSLAVILACGALFLGVGVFAGIAMVREATPARPSPWWMIPASGLGAWACGWLAMLLWSNRPFPRWFLGIFLYGPPLGLLIGSVAGRDLENGLCAAGLLAMNYWNTRSFMFPSKKKDSQPEL